MFLCFVVRMLREELQLLQEQGSYVGEVVKPMDKKKVLVKVNKEPQTGNDIWCLMDFSITDSHGKDLINYLNLCRPINHLYLYLE